MSTINHAVKAARDRRNAAESDLYWLTREAARARRGRRPRRPVRRPKGR
jgi:hypothetical protein